MEFARCVHCGQEVRLPNSSAAVHVRCPLCDAEYPLGELTCHLPPLLIVVPPPDGARETPVFESDHTLPASSDWISADATSASTTSRASTDGDQGKSSLFIPAPAVPEGNRPDPEIEIPSPTKLCAERRNARTTRNRLVPLKIALGGIAGLFLGQLVLWWLPSPHGTDPLRLAPRLPHPIAFLAPSTLRSSLAALPSRIATITPNQTASPKDPHEAVDQAIAAKILDTSETEVSAHESRELLIGLADAPHFQLAELRDAYDQTIVANHRFKAQTMDAETWYANLCELAHCVTFANAKEVGIDAFAEQTRELLRRIATDESLLDELGQNAHRVLRDPHHSRAGVAIVGEVVRVHSVGDLYQTEIALGGMEPRLVHIVSRVDPRRNSRSTYQRGDRVLILGVIVLEPSLYLLGYQGAEDSVVLGGFPVNLDATAQHVKTTNSIAPTEGVRQLPASSRDSPPSDE